ncbi:MAG: hypothetical protein WAS33_06305, partial [Candidatus Promineifilaceae bacterium]
MNVKRYNKKDDGFVNRLTILLLVGFSLVFTLSGCEEQPEPLPPAGDSTSQIAEESPISTLATSSPAATSTAIPTVTPETPATETATATAIPTTIKLTPNPGWKWHEEGEAPDVLFQLPQAWDIQPFRPKRFQVPETGSFITVQAFEFSGANWLGWIQQHKSQSGILLADGFVKQNGEVKGRPAFLFLEGGGGADAIELY